MPHAQEYSSAYCPYCDALIKVFHNEDRIAFTGDPAFCLCKLSEEDKKRFDLEGEKND